MNYQLFKKQEFINWLLSLLKEKGSLIITEQELFGSINDSNLLLKMKENKNDDVYINEIEYEEFPRILLSSFGTISSEYKTITGIFDKVSEKYDCLNDMQTKIFEQLLNYLSDALETSNNLINFYNFFEFVIDEDGIEYLCFAFDIVQILIEYLMSSPYYKQGKYQNIEPIFLKDLFKREKNNSAIGEYFDQRYIDYLYKNFQKLGKIHWRKFEELITQLFKNKGYDVTLGPGRKDGAVDIIAKKDKEIIIIQCKRWKKPVDINSVRVMNNELFYRDAVFGLFASIKGLSKDSIEEINKRKYKISVFNQNDIFEEIKNYKTTL